MVKDNRKFLPHISNTYFLAYVGGDNFWCKTLNNLKVSKENTKNTFIKLPNDLSRFLIECLVKICVLFPICTEEYSDRKIIPFKSVLHFSTPNDTYHQKSQPKNLLFNQFMDTPFQYFYL